MENLSHFDFHLTDYIKNFNGFIDEAKDAKIPTTNLQKSQINLNVTKPLMKHCISPQELNPGNNVIHTEKNTIRDLRRQTPPKFGLHSMEIIDNLKLNSISLKPISNNNTTNDSIIASNNFVGEDAKKKKK